MPEMKTTDIAVKKLRLADLSGAQYNPRSITDTAYQGLRDSLREFGMLEAPVVNAHGGKLRLVSGHQRVQALLDEGIEFADCVVVNFDDTAEKVANLTLNNPAIRGQFDPAKAVESFEFFNDLPAPDFAQLDTLLSDLREKADRIVAREGKAAADELHEASKAKAKSKVGTVYKLGRHRLYCGSYADGIPLMLGKRKVDICLTDPPYNVDYTAKTRGVIENDDLEDDEWAAFVHEFASTIVARTKGVSFIFMGSRATPLLAKAWESAGGSILRWLFWTKDRSGITRGDYRSQNEIAMVGTPAGAEVDCGSTLTNVVEAARVGRQRSHPTQKPTALVRALLEDSADSGDTVLEPFAGSGTTLVVAEELGLTCYACEMSPDHVDTIRRRWAEQVHGEKVVWTKKTPAVKP